MKGLGAWDEGNVREADHVRANARQEGTTFHFGRIRELCHERGSELEDGEPSNNIKGRSVHLGDNVKGHDFNMGRMLCAWLLSAFH